MAFYVVKCFSFFNYFNMGNYFVNILTVWGLHPDICKRVCWRRTEVRAYYGMGIYFS